MDNHLTQTEEDRAVKLRLWQSTVKELTKLASDFAAGAEPGASRTKRTDAQLDVEAIAQRKGYPLSLVQAMAFDAALDGTLSPDAHIKLQVYRHKVGLAL